MNFLDILLCIGLGAGIIKGWRNGFFVELASLVSILLGILVAIKFSHFAKSYLEKHGFGENSAIDVLAFGLTFVAVVVGVSLLAKVFTSVASFAQLGTVNSIMGSVFGLLKSILMLSVFLNLVEKANIGHTFIPEKVFENSKLCQPVQKVSRWIYPSISNWFTAFKNEAFEPNENPE